jgi:acetyl-CoA carboxylase biotin carboxylase subunit
MYLEKFLGRSRHIEFQVLADRWGNAIHLFERECSVQRRHQKLIEEAPSAILSEDERQAMGQRVAEAAAAVGYEGAGTVEFLRAEDGELYFIEMNTRLQVEHAVTEMICGLDLVREMVRIADGTPLDFGQDDIRFFGHAIECRVTAEDPETLQPAPGTVSMYHAPGGLGVRVDSALYSGYRVPPYYDSMVAKLIVHGANRNECLMRLRRALDEFVIDGLTTTIPMYRRLVGAADFINGDYDIHWMEKFAAGAATEPTS